MSDQKPVRISGVIVDELDKYPNRKYPYKHILTPYRRPELPHWYKPPFGCKRSSYTLRMGATLESSTGPHYEAPWEPLEAPTKNFPNWVDKLYTWLTTPIKFF